MGRRSSSDAYTGMQHFRKDRSYVAHMLQLSNRQDYPELSSLRRRHGLERHSRGPPLLVRSSAVAGLKAQGLAVVVKVWAKIVGPREIGACRKDL